jgi:hypothetical protein
MFARTLVWVMDAGEVVFFLYIAVCTLVLLPLAFFRRTRTFRLSRSWPEPGRPAGCCGSRRPEFPTSCPASVQHGLMGWKAADLLAGRDALTSDMQGRFLLIAGLPSSAGAELQLFGPEPNGERRRGEHTVNA